MKQFQASATESLVVFFTEATIQLWQFAARHNRRLLLLQFEKGGDKVVLRGKHNTEGIYAPAKLGKFKQGQLFLIPYC